MGLSETSWYLLQLIAQDPSVLAFVGFHAKPVSRGDHDQNLGASRERLQGGCSVERGGLERRSRRLHQPLHLTLEFMDMLLQSLRSSLRGGGLVARSRGSGAGRVRDGCLGHGRRNLRQRSVGLLLSG